MKSPFIASVVMQNGVEDIGNWGDCRYCWNHKS